MKKLTKIYDMCDVVVVPFPFIDTKDVKHRPALVISSAPEFNNRSGASVLTMITSSTHTLWPLDMEIKDLTSAGLPVPSIIRMKLFTLDNRLIIKRIGQLSVADQKLFKNNIKRIFSL